MQRFEYKIIGTNATSPLEEATKFLNDLGQEGWRVIHVTPPFGQTILLWLMRELDD